MRCVMQACKHCVCEDAMNMCKTWAHKGYCQAEEGRHFMSINCKKSCRKC